MTQPTDSADRTLLSSSDQVMNLHEAMQRLGGDEELLRELAEMFFEDAEALLEVIREGQGDPAQGQEVRRAAHSLKGLSSNFGAQRTMTAAFSVEKLAEASKLTELPPAVDELDREVARLNAGLREAFPPR
jgi:HPt (histidine-containing phosphotransfer) domain-containing protein